MLASNALAATRSAARIFEESLPSSQRKRLGQFFTGLPLGTLLAHLALDENCRTVLDPMAGHGDLLHAVAIAAQEHRIALERLDGIEIDMQTAAFCDHRTAALCAAQDVAESKILLGSAFDATTVAKLNSGGYDLVITNPPYVRYQSQKVVGFSVNDVRRGLSAIVNERASDEERALWETLVDGYSGLADLSVPAWLVAALLTRPGGRLALVVPVTWRSRDYADVVRYLLLRFFALEFIVADTQPGWFSDALVRTHLIVARRLTWGEVRPTLVERDSWPTARWLQVEPSAADGHSLVGAAFCAASPEAAFAAWAGTMSNLVTGIESRPFDLRGEWQTLQQRLKRKPWFQKAEDGPNALPLFSRVDSSSTAAIGEGLREMLPSEAIHKDLQTLDEAGIRISQGLRTGCNRFFYVTAKGSDTHKTLIMVETSTTFEKMRLCVPADTLRPVLHRQADMQAFAFGHIPPTRVLDLSGWVLPEDESTVLQSRETYLRRGLALPRTMPDELAAFVRRASLHAPDPKTPVSLIPELSAVRTNVRHPENGRDVPRFWYMLPAFTARHLPSIFTPRINHGTPYVALNTQPPILIDANFSTIWAEQKRWTNHALYGLFNSIWFRAGMEAAGTTMGGGALKLEATHIRQIPVPALSDKDCQELDVLGRQLAESAAATQEALDIFVLEAVFPDSNITALKKTAQHIAARLQSSCAARQRIVS